MNNEENITALNEDNFDDLLEDDDDNDLLEDDDDNFDDLLDGDDFTELFSEDDFDDLIEDESETVPLEILRQNKQENIQDALEFMKWANGCLKEKWLTISTSSHTTAYDKLTQQSKGTVTYLKLKEMCKKKPGMSLMQFIRTCISIKMKLLFEAKVQYNDPTVDIKMKFYKDALVCKKFEDYNKIFCTDMQIKRAQLEDIFLMRKIWELEENEKVPTEAMHEVNDYRKIINNDLIVLSSLEPSQCAAPTSIEYNNGKCIVKCECGETVDATELITFNIINIDSEDLSRAKLNELAENCRDDRIVRWLKELQDPEAVFANPSNKEMLDNLELARESTAHGIYSVYRNFILTSYGCACRFNPSIVCSCGKHIILPAKLLRYLATWHASHGEDIYRYYSDNVIAPGVIIYRDDIILDKIKTYQRDIYNTGESEVQRAIAELGNGIDTEALRRNSMARVQVEAGPTIEVNNHKVIAARSIKDAYDRIRARESKHIVNLSRYVESTIKPVDNNKKDLKDYKGSLPLDYWRSYNTSQDDKLLSALLYVVNNMNLPFDTSPKAVLSEIFRQPKAKRVRDIILMQAYYTNIMCSFDVYEHYLDDIDNEVSSEVRSVDSTNGTWRLDNSNKYELLDAIIGYLKKYSEVSEVFTEEDLTLLDDYTSVEYSTVKDFIDKLKMKHNIPYEAIRNPSTFNPPPIVEIHDIDTELVKYITDELPWRVWYKISLVNLIKEYNPKILATLATTGAMDLKVKRGRDKLLKDIITSANRGDNTCGDYFWRKIPQAIRGDSDMVLNKNLQEVALSTVAVPLPLTSNMIALLLQSDNLADSKVKVENYIKTNLINDIMERYSLDDISFDVATLDAEKVWEDAIEWVKLYVPNTFTFALPKYIRDLNTEVV